MADQLYHGLLAGSDDYGQLWSIVIMVLLLSHGCGWWNSEPEEKETGIVNDIDSLTASVDQLAEKAESSRSRDMSILVQGKDCWNDSSLQTSFLSWKTVNKF